MIEQKNHINASTLVHHLPKIMVDFELLWRCISQIWRTTQWQFLRGKIVILKYSYSCYKRRDVLAMFILVSMPFVIVTGELEGLSWRTFRYLQFSDHIQNSMFVQCTRCSLENNSKIKKSKTCWPSFFIIKVCMFADLVNDGLQWSNWLYKADWLGWFCVLYILSSYIYCYFLILVNNFGSFLTVGGRMRVL